MTSNDSFILDYDKVEVERQKLSNFIIENNNLISELSLSLNAILESYNSNIVNNISEFNNLIINKMNNFYRESIENCDFIKTNVENIMNAKRVNIERADNFRGEKL